MRVTDPETGETTLKPVVQTFQNETTEWIHVTANGIDNTDTCKLILRLIDETGI